MSQKGDPIVELSKLMVRALRELGQTGAAQRERACKLAGQAWALLHEEHPDAAERMNGVLHFLTGPRFNKSNGTTSGEAVQEGLEAGASAAAGAFATADAPEEQAPIALTTGAEAEDPVNPADSGEHPWLPAPESLTTEEAVAAYYREVSEKAAAGADFDMEVRHLIPADRHTLIIDAFNKLSPKQGFVLVNDHDPKPLYYQFAFEYADRFTWDPIEEGPEVWRVRIGRR